MELAEGVRLVTFGILSLLMLGAAFGVVLFANIVYSAFLLGGVFISMAGIYLLLNADFVSAAQTNYQCRTYRWLGNHSTSRSVGQIEISFWSRGGWLERGNVNAAPCSTVNPDARVAEIRERWARPEV